MPDGVVAVMWGSIIAFLCLAAWRLARCAFPFDSQSQLALHTVVFIWCAILVVSFTLGMLGALRPLPLAICALAFVSASTFLFIQRYRTNQCKRDDCFAESDTIGVVVPRLLWTAAIVLGSAFFMKEGLLTFPKKWDDLMYHMPLIDHWCQNKTLYAPGCADWYLPGNVEILGLWLAVPFSGDFLVAFARLPAVILLTLAILELGTLLNLPAMQRHAVAVATVTTPIVLDHFTQLKNDVATAAFFTSGIAYGLRYIRGLRTSDLMLMSASFAILIGIKYYALGYASLAWGVFTICALYRRGPGTAGRILLVGCMAAISLSGYWYVRNLAVTGLPFYPQGEANNAYAMTVQADAWARSLSCTFHFEMLSEYWLAVFKQMGICHACSLCALLPACAWLSFESLSRPTVPGTSDGLVLIALSLGAFCIFAVTPYTVDVYGGHSMVRTATAVRYSQCPLAISLLTVALGAIRFSEWSKEHLSSAILSRQLALTWPLLIATILQLGSSALNACHSDLLLLTTWAAISAGASTAIDPTFWKACAGPFLAGIRRRYGAWSQAATLIVVSGVLTMAGTHYLSQRWHGSFARFYDSLLGFETISRLDAHACSGSTIAVLDYRPYPYFGSRRQHRTIRPASVDSEQSLIDYITYNEVELIAVVRLDPFVHGRYKTASRIITSRRDVFAPVDRGYHSSVFRIDIHRSAEVVCGE
jgi:hypothetical protein